MPHKPPESRLLAAVEARLKLISQSDPTFVWRKRHGSPMGKSGDPDLYGVWRGTPFEIELKVPGENPTLLQTYRLRQWHNAGAMTFVVRSQSELNDAIDQLRPGGAG